MTRVGARAESGFAMVGKDVQCHFVPGVAAPSVFDPQLPQLRVPSHNRSVSARPAEINDPVRHRARKETSAFGHGGNNDNELSSRHLDFSRDF